MKQIKKLNKLDPLPDQYHKGNAGRILIVGGSRGLSGSVLLAGKAAMRCGSGLVTLAVPDIIGDIVEQQSLETMTLYCPSTNGYFSSKAISVITKNFNNCNFNNYNYTCIFFE